MIRIEYPKKLQMQLEAEIANGQLIPGNSFSISNLASRFSAQEVDILLVLQNAHRKGLILLERNRDVRILGLPEAKITSVFQYAEKSQLKPTTVVRKVEVIPADDPTAEKLDVSPGSMLFVQVRTRKINDEVLANQYNFIPYGICPGLEKIDLSRSSFQVALEKEFHTVIARINEDYRIAAPSRDDAEILGIDNQDRVLVIQRTSFSRNNLPVVFADIHVNPKLFHYVKELWPEASSLV